MDYRIEYFAFYSIYIISYIYISYLKPLGFIYSRTSRENVKSNFFGSSLKLIVYQNLVQKSKNGIENLSKKRA